MASDSVKIATLRNAAHTAVIALETYALDNFPNLTVAQVLTGPLGTAHMELKEALKATE